MERLIAVVAEHLAGRVTQGTYEAIACAREIACLHPATICIVVVGNDAREIGRKIADSADVSVLAVNVPGLASYEGDAYRSVLAGILTELRPGWICIPGSTQGLDFAPGLAVKLGAACISPVERVLEGDGHPSFVRSVFSGKIVAEVSVKSPAVVIVQPGSFVEDLQNGYAKGTLEIRTIDWTATRSRVLECKAEEPVDAALNEAAVIVAAGRGIGKRENLGLIEQVAALFAKGAIAGSRPLCDLGWLPYRQQVGQTGATVAPELYLACGISGAQQHLIGMRGSKLIVAVNTDPEAAIFRHADIGIVEDAETFLSELILQAEELSRP